VALILVLRGKVGPSSPVSWGSTTQSVKEIHVSPPTTAPNIPSMTQSVTHCTVTPVTPFSTLLGFLLYLAIDHFPYTHDSDGCHWCHWCHFPSNIKFLHSDTSSDTQ